MKFPTGRVTVVLTDENGRPMERTKVDFYWESPNYYRTSALTDRTGRVTFNGVPEVANVSVDYPGGLYSENIAVPQRGSVEHFVMLDTYGENSLRSFYPLIPGQ